MLICGVVDVIGKYYLVSNAIAFLNVLKVLDGSSFTRTTSKVRFIGQTTFYTLTDGRMIKRTWTKMNEFGNERDLKAVGSRGVFGVFRLLMKV